MKKILIILIFLFLLVIAFFLARSQTEEISINGRNFEIETVSTPDEREKGLSGRDGMLENSGMLFEFPRKGNYTFVMRGMKFNLDIIWISEDRIVYVAKNVPYDFEGKIIPETEADKVLELNAGTTDKYNIKEGDRVKF